MVTPQQRADELLRHWQDLWPLPAAERMKRIDDIRADLDYDDILQDVQASMLEPTPVVCPVEEPISPAWRALILFDIGAVFAMTIILWDIFRP